MSGCRISRVKFKDGRPDIHVISHPPLPKANENFRRHAQSFIRDTNDMAGYAIVAWYAGGSRRECYYNDQSISLFGETMIPAIVHDILMRRVCDPREDNPG